jgi:hypothetical protein
MIECQRQQIISIRLNDRLTVTSNTIAREPPFQFKCDTHRGGFFPTAVEGEVTTRGDYDQFPWSCQQPVAAAQMKGLRHQGLYQKPEDKRTKFSF